MKYPVFRVITSLMIETEIEMKKELRLKDGSVMMIREVTTDDAAAVLEHLEAVSGETEFLTFGPGEFRLTEAEEKEIIENYLQKENYLYLVGIHDENIVATLVFSAGSRSRVRHSGEVSMAVRSGFQANGVGSLMMNMLIKWAYDTRIIKKINLRVRTDNHHAIRLYWKKGFTVEGTIHKEIVINGSYYDLHWMGLEL